MLRFQKVKQFIRPATPFLYVVGFILLIPILFSIHLKHEYTKPTTFATEFPVTVHPQKKLIVEDAKVNEYLESSDSPLQASALSSLGSLGKVFEWVAISMGEVKWYQNLALSGQSFVTITPGLRREEVAAAFGGVLGWDKAERKAFLTALPENSLPAFEGTFAPGIYGVSRGATPLEVQALVNKRFEDEVLSRYSTSTAEIVPLETALTVASLIQRETIGTEDMREVSGVIWNRIFANMNLQLDATLQYVKGSDMQVSTWWPKVVPRDKYRKSPYNTYAHQGLPPTPIANPSVAAILAALNPVNTTCLFYFHDDEGTFHCTDTYEEHVAKLKSIYGRGR